MNQGEAAAIARSEAERKGWPWTEPVFVRRERRWILFGRVHWRFMTNADHRGGNVNIVVDDATGEIVGSGFARY
jgi:hypothetical protein